MACTVALLCRPGARTVRLVLREALLMVGLCEDIVRAQHDVRGPGAVAAIGGVNSRTVLYLSSSCNVKTNNRVPQHRTGRNLEDESI